MYSGKNDKIENMTDYSNRNVRERYEFFELVKDKAGIMAVVIYHMEKNVQVAWGIGHMYCIAVDADDLVHLLICCVNYIASSVAWMSSGSSFKYVSQE